MANVASAVRYVEEAQCLLEHAEIMPIPYINAGHSLAGMDCQGLCEYLLTRCGVAYAACNLAGSNAHYRACVWTGTPEECRDRFGGEIPAGAWLFIVENDGGEPVQYRGDGVGNASHMGVYLGNGVAIHASASRGQVAESSFNERTIPNGGWNRVGFPKWIDYGLGGISVAETAIYDARVVTSNGGHLNFRKAPRTGGTDIGDIPTGELLQVFEEVDTTWARVYWDGRFGYVQRQFLQPIIASEHVDDKGRADQNDGLLVTIELPRALADVLYDALLNSLAQG